MMLYSPPLVIDIKEINHYGKIYYFYCSIYARAIYWKNPHCNKCHRFYAINDII